MSDTAVVVGGGISGIACAVALVEHGMPVAVRDRGHRIGGRMATRTLRGTGTRFDGRVVDIGASYFTATDPAFVAVVADLVDAGTVRAWTDSFHVAGPDGIHGVTAGPMRYAAPAGLRSVVEALVPAGAEIRSDAQVQRVTMAAGGVVVDDAEAAAVALCMPAPQAERICDALPASPITWEPVIAVTCVFVERSWPELDGVFVNDDPVLTWVADDGRRRGDDAPVLVAHVSPVLAALHLHNPSAVVGPALASLRRVLGIADHPVWVETQRWTFAKPLAARPEPYWLHTDVGLGAAGDAWADGPRIEAAWLSGTLLGTALAERLGG